MERSSLDPLVQWKDESPLWDGQRTVRTQSQKTLRVTHCSQDTSKSMPQSRPALAHGQVLIKKLLDLCNAHRGAQCDPFTMNTLLGHVGACAAHFLANNVRKWSLKRCRGEKNAAVKSAGMTRLQKMVMGGCSHLKAFYLLTAIKTTRLTHCTTSSTLQSSPHTTC